jgi:hypothetical protein
VFLEPKSNLRFQTGLIGLILMVGLSACSNPTTPITPIGDPSKTSTVEGTLGTGLETDIELFSKPGLRLQATGEPDNILTGTYVVAVNAAGEVLASSSIDAKGKFSLTTNQGQAVALALATKGPSGKWLCQQTLQYQNPTDAQASAKIAALNLASASINAGNFSWKANNGRPTSAPASSAATSSAGNSNAFADESLSGFMRCGNPDALEAIVKADFDLEFSKDLPSNDPALTYTNSFVFGLDTSGPRPRFKGSADINKNGMLEMRVRHEPGQAVMLAPVITDDRPLAAGIALMPTWNLGLPANDVVQEPQLGKLTGEIVLVDGAVQAVDNTYIAGARVNWTQNTIPLLIAFGRGISGPPSEAAGTDNPGGFFRLLVPKRNQQSETYLMNITDPITLEQTNLDVNVTAGATGPIAGFSLGGNTLAGNTITLAKVKARHVTLDVTYSPFNKSAAVKLFYRTGYGPTPFATVLPVSFTAIEASGETLLNMTFDSGDTSLKNSDFVLAKIVPGGTNTELTETNSNISNVIQSTCFNPTNCGPTLTSGDFARAIQVQPNAVVQADTAQINAQIANADIQLDGVLQLSPTAFRVRDGSFLGINRSTLSIQFRWPTENTLGRGKTIFRLNFVTVAHNP